MSFSKFVLLVAFGLSALDANAVDKNHSLYCADLPNFGKNSIKNLSFEDVLRNRFDNHPSTSVDAFVSSLASRQPNDNLGITLGHSRIPQYKSTYHGDVFNLIAGADGVRGNIGFGTEVWRSPGSNLLITYDRTIAFGARESTRNDSLLPFVCYQTENPKGEITTEEALELRKAIAWMIRQIRR